LRVSRTVGNDQGQNWVRSAAADGDDDLDPVAVSQQLLAEPATRHDFAVALECDALAGEIQALEQLLATGRLLEAVGFAIDCKRDHANCFRCCGEEIFARCRVFGNLRRVQKLSCAFSPSR
jgi:hypothetical protein